MIGSCDLSSRSGSQFWLPSLHRSKLRVRMAAESWIRSEGESRETLQELALLRHFDSSVGAGACAKNRIVRIHDASTIAQKFPSSPFYD